MYYAMTVTEGFATRVGPLTRHMSTAQRWALRYNGYVAQYGVGRVWTPPIGRRRKH